MPNTSTTRTRGLTPKQARFVSEYLIDLNATQAAIRAGYSAKTAQPASSRLLSNVMVQAAVAAGERRQLERADSTKERLIRSLTERAYANPHAAEGGIYDDDGNVKHPRDWPPELQRCLKDFKVRIRNVEAGDGVQDRVYEFTWWDKVAAEKLLAQHHGLEEKHDHPGVIRIIHQLPSAPAPRRSA